MPEEYRNIYKICRKSAGFTQEAAAERLGISVESLRAYETGQRVPPDEVVETMSDLYNALHLIVRHVRERNAMYSRVVPEVPQCSVLELSLIHIFLAWLTIISGGFRPQETCRALSCPKMSSRL